MRSGRVAALGVAASTLVIMLLGLGAEGEEAGFDESDVKALLDGLEGGDTHKVAAAKARAEEELGREPSSGLLRALLLRLAAAPDSAVPRYVDLLHVAAKASNGPIRFGRPLTDGQVREIARRLAPESGVTQQQLTQILVTSTHAEGDLLRLAIDGLRAFPGAAASVAKIAGDGDRDAWVRRHAAVALGRIRAIRVPQLLREGSAAIERGRFGGDAADQVIGIGQAATPYLMKAIESPGSGKRAMALVCMADLGGAGREAIPDLVRLMATERPDKRADAAYVLGEVASQVRRGWAVAELGLARSLDGAGPGMEIAVCRALAKLPAARPSTIRVLERVRSSPSSEAAARSAVLALAWQAPNRLNTTDLRHLVAELADELVTRRNFAQEALARIPQPLLSGVVRLIVERLEKVPAYARNSMLQVLWHYGQEAISAVPGLRELQEKHEKKGDGLDEAPREYVDSAQALQWALWLCSETGSSELGRLLPPLFEYQRLVYGEANSLEVARGDQERRIAELSRRLGGHLDHQVIRCVGRLGRRGGLHQAQIERFASQAGDSPYRADALQALGNIAVRPDSALRILVLAAADSSARVRRAAAVGLGALGPVAAPTMPKILRLLDDADVSVRVSAIRASVAVDRTHPSLVQALLRRLESKAGLEQREACRALARIGPRAHSAIPHLQRVGAIGSGRGTQSAALAALDTVDGN